MTLSARALLGAAPAFVVIAGSFWLSRDHVRQTKLNEADPVVEASAPSDTIIWPSAEEQETLHRVALKQEAVGDLLDGRINLAEAVQQFELLSASGDGLANLRSSANVGTDRERVIHQVLSFAKLQIEQHPKKFATALDRLEAEARSMTKAPASTN